MIEGQTFDGRHQALNYGNKLCRTYALHLEALNKHRGKGQQSVTVTHMYVNEGGQAIVGNVETRGVASKTEEQCHALSHSPEPEMRCALEENRETVPIAGHEKR